MTRPTVHPAAEIAYALLPEGVRAHDASAGYVSLAMLAGMTVAHREAHDLVRIGNPATSPSGTCELADPMLTPRPFLAWLGWILGVDVATLPADQARSILSEVGEAQRRGSRAAIKAVVLRTLSSAVPAPRVWANLSGTDPFLISVVTSTAQTPNTTATLLAALSEKPAGMVLELQVVDSGIVAELDSGFATVNDMQAALPTVDSVAAWIPTT
jgi:hypothetical protein